MFNVYLIAFDSSKIISSPQKVNQLRKICSQGYSPEVHKKVALIAYLLSIPEDLVMDFIEIHDKCAMVVLSNSDQKITSHLQYLVDVGFG